MSSFNPFKRPSPPPLPQLPPPPPPAPVIRDEPVQDAGAEERRRRRLASGRASTILTSGQGVTESANVGVKQLLGG